MRLLSKLEVAMNQMFNRSMTPLSLRANHGVALPSVLIGALLMAIISGITLKYLSDFSKVDKDINTNIEISQAQARFGKNLSTNFLARVRGNSDGYDLISCMQYTANYRKPHISCPNDRKTDNYTGIRVNRRYPDDSLGRFVITTGCRSVPSKLSYTKYISSANSMIRQRCAEGATMPLPENAVRRIGQCKDGEQTVIEMRRERSDENGVYQTVKTEVYPVINNSEEGKIVGAGLCASRIATIQNKFELIFAVLKGNNEVTLQYESVVLNLNKTLAPSLFEFVGSK